MTDAPATTDPPRIVWSGTLLELRDHLRMEAIRQQGKWAYELLPRGALVAMRMVNREGAMRRELRLARQTPLTKPDAWEREVQVFLDQLSLGPWRRLPVAAGAHEARFLEVFPSETVVAKTVCADCGAPIPPDHESGVARCTGCAMRAGKQQSDHVQGGQQELLP